MKKIALCAVSLVLLSCNTNLSQQEKQAYIESGKKIGKETVQHLGGHLMKQMKAGGVKQAIPFCNATASPLIKEIATKHNVTIKRTSHKLRNQTNQPNVNEKSVLEQYLKAISKKEQLKPMVVKGKNGNVHFYAPIKIEKKCLSCHGVVGKEVAPATYDLIKSLYPKDQATGFKAGDLRGIINITFNK